jgi:ABC-type multidrug transport system ATPase subunit
MDFKNVIEDFHLSIDGAEKIGLLGRTGAGKTSLVMALLRTIPITKGKILIDETDITAIRLATYRSRIGVIPQDPILFAGTIRGNIDPLDEFTDLEIWGALEQIGLKEFVTATQGQLEEKVENGGNNFSSGYRQLLCIARALLRKTKILLMDEATSNVDPLTEEKIRRAIRKNFAFATVIIIAHRIDSIIACDRIAVLDQGRLLEVGHPHELAVNRKSAFSKQLDSHGIEEAKRLRLMLTPAQRASMHKRIDSHRRPEIVIPTTARRKKATMYDGIEEISSDNGSSSSAVSSGSETGSDSQKGSGSEKASTGDDGDRSESASNTESISESVSETGSSDYSTNEDF